MEPVDTVLSLATPERVRFRFRLAGPLVRALAWSFDLVIRGMVLTVFGVVAALLGVTGEMMAGIGVGVYLVFIFLLDWGYGAAFEWATGGRTPGKYALGLRVVRVDGGRPTGGAFVLRNLLRAADGLGFGAVGFISASLDPMFRRLGDLAAGTVVLRESGTPRPAVVVLDPPITEEERLAMPSVVAVQPDHLQVLEALLARRPRLSAGRLEELAAIVAPALQASTGVVGESAGRTVALVWARATGRDRN